MTMIPGEKRAPRHEDPWLLACLMILPLLVMAGKLPVFSSSAWMRDAFSLSDLPHKMQGHIEYIFFVPLSAIVVSFFRLTLGLPVLSLFRPILTAVAFRIIGVSWGIAFLVVVLSLVILIKPLIKEAHYYIRVPLLLSLAAACLVLPLMAARWWHIELLRHLAYFPLISLSLICEGFTKIFFRKGFSAALWPTVNTVLAAIVITMLARIPGAMHLVLRYPEVLFLQAGIVLLIGKYLNLRIFDKKNPFLRGTQAAIAEKEHAKELELAID